MVGGGSEGCMMEEADPPLAETKLPPVAASAAPTPPAPVTPPVPTQPLVKKQTSAKRSAKKKPVLPQKPVDPPLSQKKLMLEYFPQLFLGQKVYKWQFEVLKAIGYRNSRVALKAANGSGKTSKIVAASVIWHMMRFPGSRVVCTAGVYRQVADALWPTLRSMTAGLGGEAMGWEVTENTIRYSVPQYKDHPALCFGFSATDPNKAEGYHASGAPGCPENLLYVIDEAKGVSDAIFEKMERCQPTRLLVVSSPGGCAGEFFNIFQRNDDRYDLFTVKAHDCPHIEKSWIDEQIAVYGLKSPIVQSMIFAEFGEEDGNALILPPAVLQRNISCPPEKSGTMLKAGCDFAAGGDENVIQVIEGNAHKQTIAWREKDTMAAIGRFVTEFKRLGLEPENIWGDGSGIGIPMCDALREAGWPINRVNNGEAARDDDKFANRGTEMYVQFARMVETGKVILPNDELLVRQLTTRHLDHNSKGKLIAEPKDKLRKRGLDSPDRADALVLAFCGGGPSLEEYMKQQQGRRVTFADLEEQEGMDSAALAGCWAG